jgi:hypothetical protein
LKKNRGKKTRNEDEALYGGNLSKGYLPYLIFAMVFIFHRSILKIAL